jgi:carboxymethylenebutenolidase
VPVRHVLSNPTNDRRRFRHRREISSYDLDMALDDYIASEIVLDCSDGVFSRREAMRRLMLLGLSGPAATALLAACGSDSDTAEPISASPTAPPVTAAPAPTGATSATGSSPATSAGASPTTVSGTDEIRFPGPQGDLIGVLATAASPKGAVLVIHENRGLTPHIRSIPTRLAADGYTALAIDLLSEEGGTASMASDGDATAALSKAPAERMIADLRAGLDELARRAPGAKLAVIGFCFGGGMTWQLVAAGETRLAAAVPFYGPAPAAPDFTGSPNAAVLGIYAELDSRVNASQDTARSALDAAGLVYEITVFPGVDHAFFNDTGTRYNAEQAAAAYQSMLDWFGQHLAT